MLIIVRLIGGLGNQLFQYSAAKALSYELSIPLKIDVTPFKRYKLHAFSLNKFTITSPIASNEELRIFPGRPESSIWSKLISKLSINKAKNIYNENSFCFDGNIFNLHPPIYLNGYWQSEKYFHKYRNEIKKELKFKYEFDHTSKCIAKKIIKSNSISLHVRRSDYVSNKKSRDFHGTASISYYKRALEVIKAKINNPKFFIFSDDILWAKSNLIFDWDSTFISHNGTKNNHQDLRLMSLCKHNIIANSTFSWWGSWLNSNENKLIIAPDKWFANDSICVSDLIPNDWLKL